MKRPDRKELVKLMKECTRRYRGEFHPNETLVHPDLRLRFLIIKRAIKGPDFALNYDRFMSCINHKDECYVVAVETGENADTVIWWEPVEVVEAEIDPHAPEEDAGFGEYWWLDESLRYVAMRRRRVAKEFK